MKNDSPRFAFRWQFPLGLLAALGLIFYFWKALLCLVVFSGAWFTVSFLALRAKQNKTLSLVGGFVAALLAVLAEFALIRGPRENAHSASSESLATAKAHSSRPTRYQYPKAGTPVYFFKPFYTDKRHGAFEYESLPSGAVRFIDAYDHREYCMTQPFAMREQPLPESAVTDAPADLSALEQARNDILKIYLITSYATVKGYRYTTFRYAIDRNGTVHFDQRGSKLAIPPPYVIEENFMGEGNHPKIPDYPPFPDRG